MTTRDVLRWNFAPFDMLAISAIALAGFSMGVLDLAAGRIEAWFGDARHGMARIGKAWAPFGADSRTKTRMTRQPQFSPSPEPCQLDCLGDADDEAHGEKSSAFVPIEKVE